MSRTTNLRRQHAAALALVEQIRQLAGLPLDHDRAYELGLLISKLTGLLRIHFAQEDRILYPQMIHSTNEAAKNTASAFHAEMGDLGEIYQAFAGRWGISAAIKADIDAFRQESEIVLNALGDRIKRENEQLYPLADALKPHELRRAA